MSYLALDIAKYIIARCAENGAPVSNLKLQKILYFVLGEYHKQTGCWLFNEDVLAWRLGPVVRSVYDEYSPYGASAIYIYDPYEADVAPEDRAIIDAEIDHRRQQTAGKLVDEAHRPGGAWDSVYNGLNQTIIPRAMIAREFPYVGG